MGAFRAPLLKLYVPVCSGGVIKAWRDSVGLGASVCGLRVPSIADLDFP